MNLPSDLLNALRGARSVTVLTGAGVSKESGIPTFREAQTGLWAQYDPMELATPQAYQRDPALVWNWYQSRRDAVARCSPNAGHQALVELEKVVEDFALITQNVDGLHRRAGSRNVIELHGNIMRNKRVTDGVVVEDWVDSGEVPPRCPDTGAQLRPDVVWFGESLPAGALDLARQAAERCDVFFSIGTSAVVQPAASLPTLALHHGAILVEINPEETPLSSLATYVIRAPTGVALPAMMDALRRS